MHIEINRSERNQLLVIILVVIVGGILLLFNNTFVYLGIPNGITEQVTTYDYCINHRIKDCSLITNKLQGIFTKPPKCCTVENQGYILKQIYYYLPTKGQIVYFKNIEKARNCQDVANYL